VVAVPESFILVLKVADQRLVNIVYVIDKFKVVYRAGWSAVHDSARKRKRAPASPRAMAKRASEIMWAPWRPALGRAGLN